jgi:PmbA protein
VDGVTIAGRLQDIFRDIRMAGPDIDTRGNIHCGSLLVGKMMVAGS